MNLGVFYIYLDKLSISIMAKRHYRELLGSVTNLALTFIKAHIKRGIGKKHSERFSFSKTGTVVIDYNHGLVEEGGKQVSISEWIDSLKKTRTDYTICYIADQLFEIENRSIGEV